MIQCMHRSTHGKVAVLRCGWDDESWRFYTTVEGQAGFKKAEGFYETDI